MNWLMTLAQCAHWFNPFVWLALARMRADREMAADALVVDSAEPGEALDYGRTLVSLLEGLARRRPAFVALGILERRSRLKRRIAMLADYRPGTVRTTLLGIVALAVLAVATLTAAEDKAPQTAPEDVWAVPSVPTTATTGGGPGAPIVALESTTQTPEERMAEEQNAVHMWRLRVTPEQLEMDIAYLTGLVTETSPRRQGGPSPQALMSVRDKLPDVIGELARAEQWIAYLTKSSEEGSRKQAAQLQPLYHNAAELLALVRENLREVGQLTLELFGRPAGRPDVQAPQPETPESQEVRRKLEKRLANFDFVNQSLEAVFTFLRFVGDVNIVLDGTIPRDRTVTLQLENASIAAILTAVTRDAGLEWTVMR